MLIGSDNLVFDELAIELATINADSVVHYLPHPLHKEAIDRKVFPNIIKRADKRSWFFVAVCSPYTSLSD